MNSLEGLTLRDWFAGQALTGLIASEFDGVSYANIKAVTRAYVLADLMLEVRKHEQP